jgi:hypothetical protein
MCHHQLQWSEDYLISHSYTNSEQLNKLMKTLNELYDEAHLRQDQRSDQQANDLEEDEKPLVAIPNEGEIRSYYVLYQLDNGGEVRMLLLSAILVTIVALSRWRSISKSCVQRL